MHGPDVRWYLVLAALLFVTGALGVLIRRSPLIILLSVEIMLNGSNLALIAFARRFGHEDGQVFAIAVMAIAASEVVVGLGLIVAMGRRNVELDVDKLRTLRGMNAAAWICLGLPLGVDARDRRRGNAHLAARRRLPLDRDDLRRVRGGDRRLRRHARQGRGRPRARDDLVDVALGRPVPLRPDAADRPAERDDDADRHRASAG